MHYVFGSWFDPFTKAHEAIIKDVAKRVRKDDSLTILITDNDEKSNRTSYEVREQMVRAALKPKDITYTILRQTGRMYDFLRVHFASNDVTIVLGEDEWNDLINGKWVNSSKLLHAYTFIIYTRTGIESIDDNAYQWVSHGWCYLAKLADNAISSSAVREIFRRNPECHYKDVQQHISKVVFEFIKENQLYNQNPLNYAEIEKKFIEDYKKRGWGKFANTVDILAVSGDEVLLIRRKKPPYQNYWCTPGGFFDATDMIDKETGETVKADIDLEHAAARELREETSLDINAAKFEQIKTYSHMFDPRLRIIDTAFVVHVPHKDKKKALAGDDAADVAWFNIHNLPKMGFHHEQIVMDWLTNQP